MLGKILVPAVQLDLFDTPHPEIAILQNMLNIGDQSKRDRERAKEGE